MRIQGPSAGGTTETTVPATRAAVVDKSNGETVSVSLRAQQLASTQASGDTARAARIASLKQSVGGGGYKVDAQALGGRMADEELARAGMSSA
jgi:flagellar biosynthesis anti-sigma factor FlgM